MDPLRPLVAAGAEGLIAKLERNVLYGIIFGVMAFACALAIIAFLGLAVFWALLPDYGPVQSACLSAVAAAIFMGLLLATMRWLMQAPPASRPEREPSPLPSFLSGAQFPPKTVADVVTLVAAGIIAGLAKR